MWDLPGPGLEPMLPALAGGFLTTAPPGKSQIIVMFSPVVFLFYAKNPYLALKLHTVNHYIIIHLDSAVYTAKFIVLLSFNFLSYFEVSALTFVFLVIFFS